MMRLFFMMLFSSAVYAGGSIYDIPLQWTDENSQAFDLKQCSGKLTLVTMVYTRCQTQCPLLIGKMKSIQKLLKQEEKKVEFIVITMDPVTDTPQKLKDYKEWQKVDFPNWHFLRGDEKDTRKISVLLDIRYQKEEESGHFMHDNKVVLLDKRGTISYVLNGLDADPKPLVNAITKKKSFLEAFRHFFSPQE